MLHVILIKPLNALRLRKNVILMVVSVVYVRLENLNLFWFNIYFYSRQAAQIKWKIYK